MISILRVPAYSAKFMPKIRRVVAVALKEQTTESPDFIPRCRFDRTGGVSDLSPVVRQYGVFASALRDASERGALSRCADACINIHVHPKVYGRFTLCYLDN